MLHKARMCFKSLFLAMFKHKETIFLQDVFPHDQIWQFAQPRQLIGGICKDNVELFVASLQEAENITPHGNGSEILQLFHKTLNKRIVQRFFFHGNDTSTSSTQKFQSDASCTSKQIQSRRFFFKIEIPLKHIEQVFLGKVRGGTGLEGAWHIEVPSLVFSCYDSHTFSIQLHVLYMREKLF